MATNTRNLHNLDIRKPTVLVDERRVRKNIERIAEKARASGVLFRPHFKTHYSAGIGEIFKEYSVSTICASSVEMAGYFARYGWKDITIATPVNLRQLEEINDLAREIALGVIVDSVEVSQFLAKHSEAPLSVWIEIDVGYLRTGVWWEDVATISEIASVIKNSKSTRLKGILTHAGHSYHVQSKDEIPKIYRETSRKMSQVRVFLASRNLGDLLISVGDTPTCSLVEKFSGVDEIRPGNFVFYDLTQNGIGSCTVSDIAVAVACPVISRHPDRSELVLYGGAVHLSKDFLESHGHKMFGLIALPTEDGWTEPLDNAYVSRLSQEHGTVIADRELIEKTWPGDILMVIPVHSCLVSNLHRSFMTLDGRILPGPSPV